MRFPRPRDIHDPEVNELADRFEAEPRVRDLALAAVVINLTTYRWLGIIIIVLVGGQWLGLDEQVAQAIGP